MRTESLSVLRVFEDGPGTIHDVMVELGVPRGNASWHVGYLAKIGAIRKVGELRVGRRGPKCFLYEVAR